MRTLTVKEYDKIPPEGENLTQEELNDLKSFALENLEDSKQPVLIQKKNQLYAQNFVGILETRKGTIIEILPKINLVSDSEENSRKIFQNMLRTWKGTSIAPINQTDIKTLRNFNMFEVFIRLFLSDVVLLANRGLARHYYLVENNLPELKGKIHFPEHIRTNLLDRSRFYVEYDEFSANRPANRLIHLTIDELKVKTKHPENLKLLNQLKNNFIEVPKSVNLHDDWTKHKVDRSMPHYKAVMEWIGIFLFGDGLTTFRGKHLNQSLLFPMEKIYEDFVTHAFKNYQKEYKVKIHGPKEYLAAIDGIKKFKMKPDICLLFSETDRIILDAKWKGIDYDSVRSKMHRIDQRDMYQLFAYGKIYKCKKVGLIYPKTEYFKSISHCIFEESLHEENLELFFFPFDVTDPEDSVIKILDQLR